ncbi:hypothetical protein LSAT2_033093 [Lamellibrachia satsuma]|nr:hypothetical protein LSAT2_033093 [Lamellibrachia satsuma]
MSDSPIHYYLLRFHGNFVFVKTVFPRFPFIFISAITSLIVANLFLANQATSATFATILVDYLLAHLHDMGSNMERSGFFLKLFKLVFGSVSLLPAANELMRKCINIYNNKCIRFTSIRITLQERSTTKSCKDTDR